MKTYYDIVTAKGITELVTRVQFYLDEGWTCQGGVALRESKEHGQVFAQAVIKSEGT